MTPSFSHHALPAPPSTQGSFKVLSFPTRVGATTEAGSPTGRQSGRLMRQLSRPAVKGMDSFAMLAVLLVTLTNTSADGSLTVNSVLGLQVSVRALLVDVILLALWRVTFWLTGVYEPTLCRRAASLLWRIPLTAALCAVPMWPVVCARELAGNTPHSVPFFAIAAAVLPLTLRGVLVAHELVLRPALERLPRIPVDALLRR